jgi:hypothetical protein
VTTGGVVGVSLQQVMSLIANLQYLMSTKISQRTTENGDRKTPTLPPCNFKQFLLLQHDLRQALRAGGPDLAGGRQLAIHD